METMLKKIVKAVPEVPAESGIDEALKVMQANSARVLLVKAKGKVSGVVFLTDIAKSLDLKTRDFSAKKIKDLQNKDFLIVKSHDSLPRAVQLLKDSSQECMFVQEKNKITGALFAHDILPYYREYCERQLKEKKENLETEQEKFRVIFSNSALAITLTDKEGRITACNRAAERLLEIEEEELKGKPVQELYPPEEWEKIRSNHIRRIGMSNHLETKVIAKPDKVINVEISISAIKNPEGEIIGSMGILRDITERKLVEKQKSVLLRNLEEKNREMDDFTYIVSHDLKEPLRNVDAFSKFVVDDYKDKLGAEGSDFLERIRANISSMYNLLENLLKLSRIDRGENPIEKLEVEEIVEEVKLRLGYTIKDRNAEIVIANKLPEIYCNKVRLGEVFINLISNGMKFTKDKSPRIEIGCTDKGAYNEFYVKDNGFGIDPKYHNKIFGIFQRLVGRKEYEGTGAGLAIVKKVINVHGGEIWVDSEKGKGATFLFTIPKQKEAVKGRRKLGEILVEKGLISEDALKTALKEQKKIEKRSMSE